MDTPCDDMMTSACACQRKLESPTLNRSGIACPEACVTTKIGQIGQRDRLPRSVCTQPAVNLARERDRYTARSLVNASHD